MERTEKEKILREVVGSTNDIRIEEELTRPRIEAWPDPWVDWVSSHERRKRGETGRDACSLPGLDSGGVCGRGIH